MRLLGLLCLLFITLSGCTTQSTKGLSLKNLAKSDIDMVADLHRAELARLTRELTVKLYKRNPKELAKTKSASISTRLFQLSKPTSVVDGKAQPRLFKETQNLDGIKATQLAMAPDFTGDRVFALMVGLTGMLNRAYNDRQEFFFTDELKQQKLYNSARNLEMLSWQIRHKTDNSGHLLLLSNGITASGIENFSFERIFGKMVALQDMMAEIIAGGSNRAINRVIHGAASMTLIPI